jgi:hypothetical protein
MGRSPLIVKKEQLQNTINQLEDTTEFANIGALCEAVSQSEWGKGIRNEAFKVKGLSPQMVYKKIQELQISIKTKAGKRGRPVGSKANRSSRADKLATIPQIRDFEKRIQVEVKGTSFEKTAIKAATGSLKAACKLMCAQCVGYTDAYKACATTNCALYPINRLLFPKRKSLEKVRGSYFYETVKETKDDECESGEILI